MITIPIWLLIVAMVGGCSAGFLVSNLHAAGQAKHYKVWRDDLREQRDKTREQLGKATDRLRECEAVLAKIRGLLPPEISATYTRA